MNNTKGNKYDFKEFSNSNTINDLDKIIKKTGEKLEGNCLYQHLCKLTFKYHLDNKEDLRYNIHTICKYRNSILEVGFNGGHSVALYLYSNPNIFIRSFDICIHKYTEECANYFKKLKNFEFVKGNSMITLKEHKADRIFEIIHIDGGHGYNIAKNDLVECKKFSNKNTILIFDDAYHPPLKNLLEEYIKLKFIKEVNYMDLNLRVTKFHRIFNYVF